MEDMTARLVKLRDDAEDCALISRLANDRKKRELFARLADHLSGLADEVEHAIAEASVADLHSGDNRGCRLGGPGRPGPARGLNPAAGLFPRKRPGAGAASIFSGDGEDDKIRKRTAVSRSIEDRREPSRPRRSPIDR